MGFLVFYQCMETIKYYSQNYKSQNKHYQHIVWKWKVYQGAVNEQMYKNR